MKTVANQNFSKSVISYFENKAKYSKIKTVQYFAGGGKSKSTIYNIIGRYLSSGRTSYIKNYGRPVTVGTEKLKKKIIKLYEKKPSTSIKIAALKLNIKPSTLQYLKSKVLGIKSYKKQAFPKYTNDQKARAKSGCRYVYKKSLNKIVIMDDETYVPWNKEDIPGTKYYHSANPEDLEKSLKVKPRSKFHRKILVWQAIDENGNVSDPFIWEGNISADIYLEECIIKRLIPFIDKHYNRDEIIFWPDMATAHYAKIVKKYLFDAGVEIVDKSKNPPNVPQARGIERFWSLCKNEYSKTRKEPKNIRGFNKIWRNISNKVSRNSGKDVMKSSLNKLRKIAYKGIDLA